MAKLDPVEQAHFRIDEHERRIGVHDKMAESIPHLVEGGVAALRASMKGEFLEMLQKDIEADTKVAERMEKLIEAIHALVEALGKIAR